MMEHIGIGREVHLVKKKQAENMDGVFPWQLQLSLEVTLFSNA